MIYNKDKIILNIDNVSLKLGDKLILRDINLSIRDIIRPGIIQGQIVGLVAPSGTGKTKLFELISGILQPTTGTIKLNGNDVKLGNIGVVQQNYPLFYHRNVYNNLKIVSGKSKEEITKYIHQLGLEEHIHKYPMQLSGGQRQRVAIAQQLLCSEKLLLLDEPFSGLDVNLIDEVKNVIKEVSNLNEENTIIVVSHDIQATVSLCDTIWVMGHQKDSNMNKIPGATIVKEYDLIKEGVAWQNNIEQLPQYNNIVNMIRNDFRTLK